MAAFSSTLAIGPVVLPAALTRVPAAGCGIVLRTMTEVLIK